MEAQSNLSEVTQVVLETEFILKPVWYSSSIKFLTLHNSDHSQFIISKGWTTMTPSDNDSVSKNRNQFRIHIIFVTVCSRPQGKAINR